MNPTPQLLSHSRLDSVGNALAAERFLSSLVKFIQPIIREAVNQSAGLESPLANVLDRAKLANKIEGRELIDSLFGLIADVQSNGDPETVIDNVEQRDGEAFLTSNQVRSTVSAITHINSLSSRTKSRQLRRVSSGQTDISRNELVKKYSLDSGYDIPFTDDPSDENSVAPTTILPRGVTKTDLETMVLTKARWHVFNRMPIRLLSFNAEDDEVQLLERDDIFAFILPKIQAELANPGFLVDWAKAEKRSDSVDSRKSKQKFQEELLENVIERNAHYSILSHTWIRDTPGDVVYKDWDRRHDNKEGFAKVTQFCSVSARDHLVRLGWIDSICINKDSSTELDESIRSMYKWYRRAHVCITYLSETRTILDSHRDSWFTRGWTLQELLAPNKTCFYNMDWEKLGLNSQREIAQLVKTHTSITRAEFELCQRGRIERLPISRRLQLACGRQVTREEDTAYSLMGILGVDIPIAYGEGAERAIFRLLRELLNTKKNILDLFNRSYDSSDSLIPSSLDLFSARTTFFDQVSSSKYGWSNSSITLLDQHRPAEPLVLTHLGVRIPLLLVPGLMTSDHNDPLYMPFGSLSGKANITLSTEDSSKKNYTYNLLDKRLYAADSLAPLRVLEDEFNRWYLIGLLAVFNFGLVDEEVHLPKWCISLPLHCDGSKPGKITSSNDVKFSPWPAPVFQLKCAQNKLRASIPVSELSHHGLQLVTLYL